MNFLDKKTCPICGEPIAMVRIVNELYFYLNNIGTVIRDSNTDLMYNPKISYEPICTNDREHDVFPSEDSTEFDQWCKEFEQACKRIVMSEELYS